MNYEIPQNNPKAIKTNLWVIWGALLISVGIHFYLATQIVNKAHNNAAYQAQEAIESAIGQPLQSVDNQFFYILLGVSFVLAAMSFILKKLLHSQSLKSANFATLTETQYYSRLFVGFIISWALSEAVSIFGFLIATQTKNLSKMFPFLALSVVLFLIHRPSVKWPPAVK